MNELSSQTTSSPVWIKIWIGIGLAGVLFFVSFPSVFNRFARNEENRFRGCLQHQRSDCEPSLIWNANEWSLEGGASDVGANAMRRPSEDVIPVETVTTSTELTTRTTRSSTKAPRILSVSPEGMSRQGDAYAVKIGDAVTFRVDAIEAKTVTVFVRPILLDPDLEPVTAMKLVALKKQADGTWTGSFAYPSPGTGGQPTQHELEVRADGVGKETTSLFLPLNVEE